MVLITFEKAGKDSMYLLKSEKIVINNSYYDLIGWIPPKSDLDLFLKKKGVKDEASISKYAFFQGEQEDRYYSDHLYSWLKDEDEISVILNVIGACTIINKLPSDRKYGNYNHYSCPISIDTINTPYCKIISIDSCYSPNANWLSDNLYYKINKNNFKVNFCD